MNYLSELGLRVAQDNTGRNKVLRLAVVSATIIALMLTASVLRAQNAYDHFGYPVGPINGQNGGVGWAGPWAGAGDNVVPGLTVSCNGQLSAGNALGPTNGPASTRALTRPVQGVPGTSLILSAVINSNVNGSTFTQATLGNSSGGTFIIGELPETDPRAANWALQNAAGVYYSVKPVVANAPTCLVARIDFSVNGNLDRMRVWVNPPQPLSLALPADIDVTTAHITLFSGIFWQSQQAQVVDEIGVNSAGGTWTKITNTFPGCSSDATLLLTDGSVLVQDSCSSTDWYKFEPDIYGSYIKGMWTKVAPIPAGWNYAPTLFGSAVLPDGRVIIEGGEYGQNPNGVSGAIYDPVANAWAFVPAPGFGSTCGSNGTSWCAIGGPPTVVLPDGSYMIGDGIRPPEGFLDAVLPPPYDTTIHPWSPTGPSKHDINSEEGWTLLPRLSYAPDLALVLSVDTDSGGGNTCGSNASELYIKGPLFGFTFNGDWYCLPAMPSQLYQTGINEIGPTILRPDGTVFAGGATQSTAIFGTNYTWTAGPDFPRDSHGNQLVMYDAPAALLPNGNVLAMTSPYPGGYYPPATFLELTPDPSNVFVQVPGVSYASQLPTTGGEMLVLPTGQVWLTPVINAPNGAGVEIYTPANRTYDQAWAPHIQRCRIFFCVIHALSTNTIRGTGFNGMSQASAFGDEYQDATNYPLVRITEAVNSSGQPGPKIYYCRTHDHSSMGVATGNLLVSTKFECNNVPPFTFGYLEVVANGIPSNAIPILVTP